MPVLQRNSTFTHNSYRYGFQAQASIKTRTSDSGSYVLWNLALAGRDDELKGAGNSVNYTYRMHDTRLGRFFAVDPLVKRFPQWSPYVFSGNIIIMDRELEGLEPSKGDPNYGKNIIIADPQKVDRVMHPEKYRDEYDVQLDNQNWIAVYTKTYKEMSNYINTLVNENPQLKAVTVYIQGHGGSGSLPAAQVPGKELDITRSSHPEHGVTGEHIDLYLEYMQKGEKQFFKDNKFYSDNEAEKVKLYRKFEAIKEMEEFFGNLPEGSTVIFGNCNAGNESNSGYDTQTSLTKLAKNRVNIVMSTGSVTVTSHKMLDKLIKNDGVFKGKKKSESESKVLNSGEGKGITLQGTGTSTVFH
jgi:hypothetical protein